MRWSNQTMENNACYEALPSAGLMQTQNPGTVVGVQTMPPQMRTILQQNPNLAGIPPNMDYLRPVARSQDDQQVPYFCQRSQDDEQMARDKGRWNLADDTLLEIAPTAKKLWGVDEGKADTNRIFNLEQAPWRDAWSTAPHSTDNSVVAPGLGMNSQRGGPRGQFATDNVLSQRVNEGGVGVKMVEYLLATSPLSKDLDSRMSNLSLRNGANDNSKEKKDKSQSPFDQTKKDLENGNLPQANGTVQNGLEEDKQFNATPGSRGGSPSEEDHNKNGMIAGVVPVGVKESDMVAGGVVMNPQVLNLEHTGFEQMAAHHMLDPSMGSFSNHADYTNMATSMPMDSPVLQQQNFAAENQFRNGNAPQQGNPQQIQLLAAQQQYLAAAQQQGLQGPATFGAPYVINGPEQYVGTLVAGPTAVIPQYYGVHWGVYPANIIQQQGGPGAQQRRPQSPSQNNEVPNQANQGNLAAAPNLQGQLSQYQVIPTYYDQNGTVLMGNLRGIGNAGPVRLVSPAPVIINSGNAPQAAAAANSMRLLSGQTPQIATPPASLYNQSQTPNLSSNSFAGSSLADSIAQGLHTSNSLSGNNYSLNLQNNALGFGSGAIGTIGSPSIGNLGSGLTGSNGMNRRDSLDRNSSVLSPLSQDFRSKNWTSNYGALGTVTASPGPIGLSGGSGTISPPTGLNSSSALPLGALVSGNRVISAAPGAEAKFRSGSNGIFSSNTSSGLFGPLKRSVNIEKCAGRSRLLEDFRNNRYPNLQLRDLVNHIVEFSQDQHGSRFIQQKLERASTGDKQMVFNEILHASYALMTDVFGNYVIQKFFEFGTSDHKSVLANKIRGHVLPLALQMYGCRVIQKALECITTDQQKEIVRELDGHVLKCVKDQNGNHVVQKCIECVEPTALQFIINDFKGQVLSLSTHPYGCRVIQRILEHCNQDQTIPVLEELHQHTEQLLQDQYGNYVIQHVLEHGKSEQKSKIVEVVRGAVMKLAQHKFASNVVEKCVSHASRAERSALIEEICGYSDTGHNNLLTLMKDQYANYVVQKMIDVAEQSQRKMLMHKIRPHLSTLKKYTYGKHIIAKLEKYFNKNPSETLVPSIGPL